MVFGLKSDFQIFWGSKTTISDLFGQKSVVLGAFSLFFQTTCTRRLRQSTPPPSRGMVKSVSEMSLKSNFDSEDENFSRPTKSTDDDSYQKILENCQNQYCHDSDEQLASKIEISRKNTHEEYLGNLIMVSRFNRKIEGLTTEGQNTGFNTILQTEIQRETHYSSQNKRWHLVRIASGCLKKYTNSLAPSFAAILSIGVKFIKLSENCRVSEPKKPEFIIDGLYKNPKSLAHACLKQELLVHFGKLASMNPELLADIFCLDLDDVIQGLTLLCNEGSFFDCSPARVKFWLLAGLGLANTGKMVNFLPWLGNSSNSDQNITSKIGKTSKTGPSKTTLCLTHYFCIFPPNFEFELENLNKLVPLGIFYKNNRIHGIDDLIKTVKKVEQKFEIVVRENLVKLVLQLAKFIKKCPIEVKVRLELFNFVEVVGVDTELSKLLLKKVVLDSDEGMQSLSSCITS